MVHSDEHSAKLCKLIIMSSELGFNSYEHIY